MNKQLKQNLGFRVKTARLQKGMTQAQLAEAIDKAFETISNIERGKTAPNFSTLADISATLGVPMRDFFDIDEAALTDARQKQIVQLNTLASHMDERTLGLLLKLGQVLQEESQ